MLTAILKRLAMLVPILVGITIVAFLLLQVMPGDPASRAMGTRASAAELEAMRRQWGLDLPIWRQYLRFLGDVASGSFGMSLFHKLPVSRLVFERLPWTLAIVAYSTALALAIAVPAAIAAALRRGGWLDAVLRQLFVLVLAAPPFWLAFVAIIFLSLKAGWFPTGGVGHGLVENLHRLFLPSMIVGLSTAALIYNSLRGTLVETLKADFIDTARAKGLTGAQVFRRHVLPNSLISTISIVGVRVGWIVGGTVVVEKIFSVPGLGSLLIDSILARDLPVIRGLTVVFAILIVLVNLLTDIAYALADPRVKLG